MQIVSQACTGIVLLGMMANPVAAQVIAPDSAPAASSPFSYRFDVRQPTGGGDKLGVDFDLSYERRIEPPTPIGWNRLFVGSAKGYQDFAAEVRELDNITFEGKLAGEYYSSRLSAEQRTRLGELIIKGDLSDKEQVELRDLLARQSATRRFWVVDAHYRVESDQDLDEKQHVAGIGLAGELPGVHNLLGLAAEMLGGSGESQPVRAFFGLDYATTIDSIEIAGMRFEGGYPRARFEVAWSAPIFQNLRLRTLWQAHYLFDPPAAIELADREFNHFFEAWVIYPISETTGLIVKYADGHLPPNYSQTSTARLGFTISLQ